MEASKIGTNTSNNHASKMEVEMEVEMETALDWNSQGTRKVCRPKITWKRIAVNEAKAAGTQWSEVKALAKNRIRWRQFVDALCSLVE